MRWHWRCKLQDQDLSAAFRLGLLDGSAHILKGADLLAVDPPHDIAAHEPQISALGIGHHGRDDNAVAFEAQDCQPRHPDIYVMYGKPGRMPGRFTLPTSYDSLLNYRMLV